MPEMEMLETVGTPAEQAVQYVLARIPKDANFAYYLFGTETLARCVQAEAERTGQPVEDVKARLNSDWNEWANWRREHGIEEADAVAMRQTLERASRQIYDALIRFRLSEEARQFLSDLKRDLDRVS